MVAAQPARLTPRQRDVLRLIVQGRDYTEIAADLGISKHTVKMHTTAIRERFGLHGRNWRISAIRAIARTPRP